MQPHSRLDPSAVREALSDLWRDYHWPVKLVFSLIILSSLWATALVGWPELDAGTPRWLRMLASDPLRYLLSVLIAFLIAINFYMRARRGVLDGDEHYNVARALAFGYFKNFLVPALQLAEKHDCELHIFHPDDMAELQEYASKLRREIEGKTVAEWLPLAKKPSRKSPPVRHILGLLASRNDPDKADYFFDAPTTLFTIGDFYATLKKRRMDSGKPEIDAATIRRYQNGQIASFFNHIDYLFTSEPGHAAVRHYFDDLPDIKLLLSQLHGRLREVSLEELRARFASNN